MLKKKLIRLNEAVKQMEGQVSIRAFRNEVIKDMAKEEDIRLEKVIAEVTALREHRAEEEREFVREIEISEGVCVRVKNGVDMEVNLSITVPREKWIYLAKFLSKNVGKMVDISPFMALLEELLKKGVHINELE